MTLGERVAVMSNGVLQQLGAPQDVYDHPANLFVAGFIGSPPMNLLRAEARGGVASAGDLSMPIAGLRDGDVVLGLRPEHLRPATDGQPSTEFQVEVVEPLGDGVIVHGTVSGTLVTAPSGDDEVLPRLPGERAEMVQRTGELGQVTIGRHELSLTRRSKDSGAPRPPPRGPGSCA
jgi:ABC-type sugar transport system ATPase subunit